MASLFRYNLCLISCGAPAGLAVYHYCVKESEQPESEINKCCCGGEVSCEEECKEPCEKKEK